MFTTGCGRRADVGPVVVSAIGRDDVAPAVAGADRGALALPDQLLTDAIAEGLVRFDAAGQVETGAAERWIVTDEGTSFIFRLREATWPDAQPVRAGQVAALLRRQIARGGDNQLAPYLSAIDAVVEMTPEVVEISLSRPRPDLLKLFAQPELGLVRGIDARTPGGAGPFRIARRWPGGALLLTPVEDAARDPDALPTTPEQNVVLRSERAARAIARFVLRGSDLVSGGTMTDWPLVTTANPAPVNIRVDPAAGLFGLAVARREGFLADPANRAAIAAAIDRGAIAALFSPEWQARETVLPEQLDSAAVPAVPAWSATAAADRVQAARERVAAWRRDAGEAPVIGVALPEGPGARLVWARIAADLFAIGVRPVRLPLAARDADLRLVDRVAPYDSARWYLAEACAPCSPDATAAIERARLAATLAERGSALAAADAALTADAAFIPIARPFRWSLVAQRLRQWQPNTRAWHPLNRLRNDTN